VGQFEPGFANMTHRNSNLGVITVVRDDRPQASTARTSVTGNAAKGLPGVYVDLLLKPNIDRGG
jgi:hypothetical protein